MPEPKEPAHPRTAPPPFSYEPELIGDMQTAPWLKGWRRFTLLGSRRRRRSDANERQPDDVPPSSPDLDLIGDMQRSERPPHDRH